MAKSPAIAAFPSVPANAAQVLSPMRAFISAPISLILQENEVAHHHVVSALTSRHGQPSAEAKWCGDGQSVDGNLKVISRYVDFQDVRFVISLLPESLQNRPIFGRHVLRINPGTRD